MLVFCSVGYPPPPRVDAILFHIRRVPGWQAGEPIIHIGRHKPVAEELTVLSAPLAPNTATVYP